MTKKHYSKKFDPSLIVKKVAKKTVRKRYTSLKHMSKEEQKAHLKEKIVYQEEKIDYHRLKLDYWQKILDAIEADECIEKLLNGEEL